MLCPSCDQDNPEDSTFCGDCGASLAAEQSCPSCGKANPSGLKFCRACGAGMAEPAKPAAAPEPRSYTPRHLAEKILRDRATLEGERRTVTALFADAIGFTPISERLDEEEVYDLMQGCLGRMMDAVHRYEGTVTQFRGDGVMALFGAPIAHEDAARRAVAAALEMQKSLDEYATEVKQRHPIECRFRVGLNTGPVVVGKISDNLDMDYTALGDTVNLASRMEELAEPGTVYLSEDTYRAVQDYFECESLGALTVKGKAEPVVAYRVVRETAVRTRFEAAAERGLTPFVGRDQEQTVLRGYLEQAKRGQGQVVFVSGEAGIGKSRLLLEFRRSTLDEGVTWLEGHCSSYGKNIPYLPVIDILKREFDVQEGDDDAAIIGKVDEGAADWDETARATVSYLKYLLNVDPGDAAVTAMDPLERRAGIFDGLRALLLQESQRRPLVMVVEDLHWIDEKSEEALAALVDVVASAPVLLVLTYRPGYAHSLGDRSYFSRLALGHLPPEESAAMAERVLQVATLPEQLREVITGKAEGNPFYIEEVTKSLVEAGVLRKSNGSYSLERPAEQVRVPDTIQEVILSRIDRLERRAKEAIQLASVIGREFTVRLLDRISDVEAKLDDLLGELKSLELIYEKTYFPELSYMFKHALTHDVAYSTLLLERRKALHSIVAAAIEELYADRLTEHYEALAHHYYEGQEWEKALDYLVRAGEKAAAAFANQDALAYYDRALRACDHMSDVPVETLMGIYGGKAGVSLTINDWTAVVTNYGHLRELAGGAGNRAVEGLALGGVAFGHVWTHEFDLAEAAAHEALSLADDINDDAIRAGAFFVIGFLDNLRGNLAPARQRMTEAIRLSQETGQPAYEVFGHWFQSLNHSWRGLYEQAHRIAEEAVAAGEQHHVTFPLLINKWAQALAFASHGRYDDAIAALRDTIAMCERMGDNSVQSRAWNTLGWVHGELCDWEKGIEFNQKGLDLALVLGDPEITINAQINLADYAFATGEREQARRELDELYASLPQRQEWMKWRYSQHIMHSLGEVLLAAGETERALALADECLTLAESTETRKNVVKGRRLRGQALLAQGKLAEAEEEFATALEVAKEIGNPPQLWKTHAALGDLRQAQDRPDDARKAYRDALAVIEGVAGGLEDESLRETFLTSEHVQGIRAHSR
ncbi:MAG: AAA family ATPase [Chloroflexi bacterium]|nr:AAA family ATPase [Chloroflexota bacterium]